MRVKSEKGVTGIDISIAVVLIFIFVSIIAVQTYNFNSKTTAMERKSEATECAIAEIEKIKKAGIIDEYLYINIKDAPIVQENVPVDGKDGFFKTIKVEDYKTIANEDNNLTEEDDDDENEVIPDVVKRVTVIISYKDKKETQNIELQTILTKGD